MTTRATAEPAREYRLDHRYTPGAVPALLTGTQAVVRLLVEQNVRDAGAGLRTAAFVSGYPGSPLGGLDRTLAQAASATADHDIRLVPALNEELAATGVWGTQQDLPGRTRTRDGIVGVWYGKSPGLDRAGDPIRHGNMMGAHPRGGVLVLVGDDPGAKSSTLPCASERTLAALGLPVLFPRNSEEIITLGLHGIALSRASGCWIGMKITADVADGFSSVSFNPSELAVVTPRLEWEGTPWTYAPGGVPMPPANLIAERALLGPRWAMVKAFIAENTINTVMSTRTPATVGLVAAGKTYDDLDQALVDIGLDGEERDRVGLRTLRLGMVSPLSGSQIRGFASGLSAILVVEEKAPFIEAQVRDALYGTAAAPMVFGKRDDRGEPLVPGDGELIATRLREPIRRFLHDRVPLPHYVAVPARPVDPLPVARTPYFCSGCPHNRSTVVPEGSLSSGGIGCHAMVALIPRPSSAVTGLTQMGGEGAQWIGQAGFYDVPHIFQNMGDGTFFHSGQLAIQACVAAGVNITFKILYNAAIAMTGGQDPQGALDVPSMTRKLAAEGVERIIVCADEPRHYPNNSEWAPGVAVWHRDRLDEAQQLLRSTPGVTVLVYDQQCAAEARRLRKRGVQPTRSMRVVINEAVCEGCGDCGAKSNCLSVQPVETEFGRKTRIDQASCNTDYSCLDGDCPAFVTVEAPTMALTRLAEPLRAPVVTDAPAAAAAGTVNVVTVGVGGTGVVTVNQVLATAALLDGHDVRGVDQTGLSQKAGPVTSHLRFGAGLEPAGRVGMGAADCLLAFDLLASNDPAILALSSPDRTDTVASTTSTPTGQMVASAGLTRPDEEHLLHRVRDACRSLVALDATAAAARVAGDPATANFLLVGAAVQSGALPLRPSAIEAAIGMNGVAVDANVAAFRWGRVAVADHDAFVRAVSHREPRLLASSTSEVASDVLGGETARLAAVRASYLVGYQSMRLARDYLDLVERAWEVERRLGADTRFSEAVARGLHHLMAYKDEYEVARLLVDPAFSDAISSEVPGAKRVRFRLHPPTLRTLGLRRKISIGPIGRVGLRALAYGRRLRGTPLDPFGYARMRRLERNLVAEYRELVERLIGSLAGETYETAVAGASAPLTVRGFEGVKLASIDRYHAELERLGLR